MCLNPLYKSSNFPATHSLWSQGRWEALEGGAEGGVYVCVYVCCVWRNNVRYECEVGCGGGNNVRYECEV